VRFAREAVRLCPQMLAVAEIRRVAAPVAVHRVNSRTA
jgi:hypothetical protein